MGVSCEADMRSALSRLFTNLSVSTANHKKKNREMHPETARTYTADESKAKTETGIFLHSTRELFDRTGENKRSRIRGWLNNRRVWSSMKGKSISKTWEAGEQDDVGGLQESN